MRSPDEGGIEVHTDALAATPAALARPGAAGLRRVLALAVVPVYLALVTAYLLLARSTGTLTSVLSETGTILPGFGVLAATGSLIALRRPGNALGWVMAGTAVLIVAGAAGDAYAAWVMTTRGHADALAVAGAWLQSWYWYLLLWLLFVAVPLLFPDGRLLSRRWRIPVLLSLAGTVATAALGMLTGTLTGQDVDYRIANPIGIAGFPPVEDSPAFPALGSLLALGIGTAIIAVVVRFRRSRGDERQQMKWFVYALWPLLLFPLLDHLRGVFGGVVLAWLVLAVPVALAIAAVVVRFRRSRGDERQQMKCFVYAFWPLVLFPLADHLPGIVGSTSSGAGASSSRCPSRDSAAYGSARWP